ncbi:hypothetical protein [Ruminiclostridium cellulolyticum]|uniref:Yip1 domain-containing protein n=1 Tax=Ruminiclostridium cellulolyticum (strain ATCC 35319 / DSM 5812 / JCM 6584 / H10) TaxID=394503 RepID=B8I8U6_RUMCH|nr:hypothetical protein [Ruminiclostridium cellulolyticum]ACL77278.1 hypothetical protein Ccel_2984 [Ruminiclostridium cellulolyticum H10]
MKSKYNTFIDFFLLQKDFYSKLTDKSLWLYIGIVFVGLRDVIFYILNPQNPKGFFITNLSFDLKTASILLITALLIGFIDVLCFSYPVFDVIKHFKKKSERYNASVVNTYSSLITKVMKVYILANIILTPMDIIIYFSSRWTLSTDSMILLFITTVMGILSYFWFNGVITRGLCMLFRLSNNVRGLVFVLVFFWNALISSAIQYLLSLVIMRL